ncbi:hypothetical protein MUK42_19332 [Musa troglodytarum]|uniref:Uncharacterized protein n=1 Tax=Musa troglodytarum TaxID=320322 RepID=A0A9E7FZI0_9LILI|nr:hypothetical protein MUK42_19332 [Musa troglodytarum]URE03913.1 hypothetical protein MUK42_19332 [Musa troglodytarum]
MARVSNSNELATRPGEPQKYGCASCQDAFSASGSASDAAACGLRALKSSLARVLVLCIFLFQEKSSWDSCSGLQLQRSRDSMGIWCCSPLPFWQPIWA